jgi:hypothetical protein
MVTCPQARPPVKKKNSTKISSNSLWVEEDKYFNFTYCARTHTQKLAFARNTGLIIGRVILLPKPDILAGHPSFLTMI